MRSNGRVRGSFAMLAAIAVFVTGTQPAGAGDVVSLPPDQNIAIRSTDWLNGQGVGVYYSRGPYDDHPQNPDGTVQYECIDLVMRLYRRLGYPSRWPLQWAYEVSNIAGRPGFDDMVFQANGAPQPPKAGDIVVWPSYYHGGTGHVAIVNKIVDNWVQVVHQNVWRGFRPMPFSNLVLQRDGSGRYFLVGRDGSQPAGWIHSQRMEHWLARQPRLPAPSIRAAL